MNRRLPPTLALVAFACCATVANAAGGGGRASAPAPAPSGGSGHGGGSAHGGGSSRGSGGGASRGSGGSARGSGGSSRAYGGGSAHGSGPVYGGGTARGGGSVYGGGTSRAQGSQGVAVGSLNMPYTTVARQAQPGVQRNYEFRWVCANPGGGVYYSWAGPCDFTPDEPGAAQQAAMGIQRGQATGFENGTDYATDPWAVGIGPGAGTPRMADLPVLTRSSDTIAPYAVILRDGMAFASTERPKQAGKMIVARDRGGNLFSIKASEVDMAATKPAP
jgi:hypothetical protein